MKSKKRNIGQEILEAIEGIKAGKGKHCYICIPDVIRQVLKPSGNC